MQKKKKYKGVKHDKTCKLWRCKRERESYTLEKKSVALFDNLTHTHYVIINKNNINEEMVNIKLLRHMFFLRFPQKAYV